MKFVRKNIEKDNVGQVILVFEEFEDMWYIYNFVQVGDSLCVFIICKVQIEFFMGSVGSNWVCIIFIFCVEVIDFDF